MLKESHKRIAFDYGGVLRKRDGQGGLRGLVKLMHEAGFEIYVISATGDPVGVRKQIEGLNLPIKEIHTCPHGGNKLEIMKGLGCCLLFDDSPNVCRSIEDGGLLAVRVFSEEGSHL